MRVQTEARPEGIVPRSVGIVGSARGVVLNEGMPPAMTPEEIRCYRSHLERAERVVEYGAGGSTMMAVRAGVHTYTVESDSAWIARLRSRPIVVQAEGTGRLTLTRVDIGPVKGLGKPADDSKRENWPLYAAAPWDAKQTPDLVLIDGRFRVACILQAVLHAPRDCIVFAHDFWNRPRYHVVLPYLHWQQSVGSVGVFRIGDETDGIEALLQRYSFVPD